MTTTLPRDPLAAVIHPNPYPYYADLLARRPIYRDEVLGLWIVSSAATVSAVLTSEICRVRPLAEPVPRALLGSPAAEIFRHLVRMNDGAGHCPFKQAVSATLQSIDTARIAEQGNQWARFLLEENASQAASRHLENFAFRLPVYVIASLLGVPRNRLEQTALWMDDFVRCLIPGSSAEQIERGKIAAGHLFDLFRSLLHDQQAGAANNLLMALAIQAKGVGREDTDTIIANGIGFLSQAYEATAGLIGNTVVALTSQPGAREQVAADPTLLHALIEEVLRYDPPVQNTRRFLAQSGIVADQEMQRGDSILVVLAAANRDPAANPQPERFDLFRKERRIFTFGNGIHACPGDTLAMLIAQAGIAQLLASKVDLEQCARSARYRPSANLRIALPISETDA